MLDILKVLAPFICAVAGALVSLYVMQRSLARNELNGLISSYFIGALASSRREAWKHVEQWYRNGCVDAVDYWVWQDDYSLETATGGDVSQYTHLAAVLAFYSQVAIYTRRAMFDRRNMRLLLGYHFAWWYPYFHALAGEYRIRSARRLEQSRWKLELPEPGWIAAVDRLARVLLDRRIRERLEQYAARAAGAGAAASAS